MDGVKDSCDEVAKWMRVSHAALRLRCESPQWAREHAALQTRRDTCFSQAVCIGQHYLCISFKDLYGQCYGYMGYTANTHIKKASWKGLHTYHTQRIEFYNLLLLLVRQASSKAYAYQ